MSGRRLTGAATLLALAVVAQPAMATEASALPVHNPFRRPAQAVFDPATQGGGGAPPAEAAAPRLVLKALLLAGPDTVASINDELLRIGERIEGYRLVAVEGTQAVLFKDGKRLILDMEDEERVHQ
jgi:hypothetical protein